MSSKALPKYYRKAYQDFSGGLNTQDNPLLVRPNQFTTLTNALVNSTGVLEKCKGYVLDGSPFPNDVDSFIRMLVNYKRGTTIDALVCAALDEGNTNSTYKIDLKETTGDGNYAYIGHTAGTEASFTTGNTAVTGVSTVWSSHLKAGDKIKASSHSDSAYTEIATVNSNTSLTLVAGGYLGATAPAVAYKARIILNKDTIPSACVFNNNLIITNGSDTPMSYNSTTLNKITDADCPKGSYIVAHKSRLFIAATSGSPSNIYWSAVNDETSWDASSFEPVFANDNGNICGIRSFADSLIVFKTNGNIYQVIGNFDQDAVGEPDYIRKIDVPNNIGTIAGFSPVVNRNNLYFYAETGIYALSENMQVIRISDNIVPTTDSVILTTGATASKSFIYDSKSEWDNGTYSGVRSSAEGTINRISDKYTHTDAYKANNLSAIRMASNGDIHYVYVGSDQKTIKYNKITATDETTTSYDVTTAAYAIRDLSLDINSTGDVVVAWILAGTVSAGRRTYCSELLNATTTWSETLVRTMNWNTVSCSVKYGTAVTTDIFLISSQVTDIDVAVFYDRRISGAWSGHSISERATNGTLSLNTAYTQLDMCLDGSDNLAFSVIRPTIFRIYAWHAGADYWNMGGFPEEYDYTVSNTQNDNSRPQWIKNSTGERICVFSHGSTIKARNLDTSATTVVDASYGNLTGIYMNGSNQYSYMRFDSSGTETLVYNSTTALVNSVTGVLSTSYRPGNRGFDSNGTYYCSIHFGANANEVVVRRMAPVATWTGPEQADASLSSWGTYIVTGQTNASDTILHEIALNTISPPSSYSTITSGSLISTDATKVYAKARISFTAGSFIESSVESLTLNYVGTGVSATFPVGVLYDHDYYLSHGMTGDSSNTQTLLLDKNLGYGIIEYPVLFMERYKGLLYGGSAISGKVFRLIQGYNFNGSAYTLTATTKEDLLGSLELEKEVYKIYIIYKTKSYGDFDFSYRTNNFTTASDSAWVTTTIDQTQDGIAEIPGISGKLRSIQFKITSSDIDAEMNVVGFVILYDYLNVR